MRISLLSVIFIFAYALSAFAQEKPNLFPEKAINDTVNHMESQKHVQPPRSDEKPFSNNPWKKAQDAIKDSPVRPMPQHHDPYAPKQYGVEVEKKF